MALDQLHSSKNDAEIRYWYTEWSPERYTKIQSMNFEEAWYELFDESKYGWSSKHEKFCENLIKGQPFLRSCGKWSMVQK